MIEFPPKTDNFLDDSKTWNELLSLLPEGAPKDAVGKVAVNELAGRNRLFGCDRIYVRSHSAFAVPDTREGQGGRQAMELDAVAVLGNLGLPDYIILENGGALTWRIYDAQSVEFTEETLNGDILDASAIGLYMPIDRPIKTPLHLPVGAIELALPVPTNMWKHLYAA